MLTEYLFCGVSNTPGSKKRQFPGGIPGARAVTLSPVHTSRPAALLRWMKLLTTLGSRKR